MEIELIRRINESFASTVGDGPVIPNSSFRQAGRSTNSSFLTFLKRDQDVLIHADDAAGLPVKPGDMNRQSEELGGKPSFFKREFKKYRWVDPFDKWLRGHPPKCECGPEFWASSRVHPFLLTLLLTVGGLSHPFLKTKPLPFNGFQNGGRGGIRTHVRIAPKPDFESGAFNRSATLPAGANH